MAKKSANEKRDERKDKAIKSFNRFVQIFDINKDIPIPVMCLDVSTTSTGFMMMSANIFDDDNELADLVPLSNDESTWDKTQTLKSPEKAPSFMLFPHSYDKIINFRIKLEDILTNCECAFMEKHNLTPSQFYSKTQPYPKFLAVESVFLFQKSAIIPLTRFQNTAIAMLMDRGYIPFEYDNQEAKGLLGAGGKKQYVVPIINDMYCIDIPVPLNEEDDRYTHVGDAIALGYYHNYIMRKAIRER